MKEGKRKKWRYLDWRRTESVNMSPVFSSRGRLYYILKWVTTEGSLPSQLSSISQVKTVILLKATPPPFLWAVLSEAWGLWAYKVLTPSLQMKHLNFIAPYRVVWGLHSHCLIILLLPLLSSPSFISLPWVLIPKAALISVLHSGLCLGFCLLGNQTCNSWYQKWCEKADVKMGFWSWTVGCLSGKKDSSLVVSRTQPLARVAV